MERLEGVSKSASRDGTESAEIDGAEYESDSLSPSLETKDFSLSSGGLSRTSSAEFPVPQNSGSSSPSISNLLKSCTWFPRGNLRDSRAAQLRRGTGIAVASNIDAIDVGTGRSPRAIDDVWRVTRVFFGVLGSCLTVPVCAEVVR